MVGLDKRLAARHGHVQMDRASWIACRKLFLATRVRLSFPECSSVLAICRNVREMEYSMLECILSFTHLCQSGGAGECCAESGTSYRYQRAGAHDPVAVVLHVQCPVNVLARCVSCAGISLVQLRGVSEFASRSKAGPASFSRCAGVCERPRQQSSTVLISCDTEHTHSEYSLPAKTTLTPACLSKPPTARSTARMPTTSRTSRSSSL